MIRNKHQLFAFTGISNKQFSSFTVYYNSRFWSFHFFSAASLLVCTMECKRDGRHESMTLSQGLQSEWEADTV